MLLRSSSTPVLGSLLSSFSESPNNTYHQPELPNSNTKHASPSVTHKYSKLSYKHAASPNFNTSLCNSSPISPSIAEFAGSSPSSFRRAQSAGNLEGLASDSSNNIDEFIKSFPSKKFARRPHNTTLEAIPSVSFYNSRNHYEDEDSDEEEDMEEEELTKENNKLFQDSLGTKGDVGFKGDWRYANGYGNVGFGEERGEMYLARGLGVSDANFVCSGGHSGGSGGGQGIPVAFDGDSSDSHGVGIEEHYKRLLEENPCNSLYLRNYAQFLHQTKRDLQSAEEYYSRAILSDPKDGEVLSHYANLVWELYSDKDRATGYFERAIQASGEDSHVHAAYASFLWETEGEDEEGPSHDTHSMPTLIREGVAA